MPILHGPKCCLCGKPVSAVIHGRRVELAPQFGGCDCPSPDERPPGWKPNRVVKTPGFCGIHYSPLKTRSIADALKRKRPKP